MVATKKGGNAHGKEKAEDQKGSYANDEEACLYLKSQTPRKDTEKKNQRLRRKTLHS